MTKIPVSAVVEGGEVKEIMASQGALRPPKASATDLRSLLERVKAAEGPDREIDGLICRAIDSTRWTAARHRASQPCGAPEDVVNRDALIFAPDYTASVDQALALVERKLPGWQWDVGHLPYQPEIGFAAEIWPAGDTVNDHNGSGKTAPLAILAALLSALIAESEQ